MTCIFSVGGGPPAPGSGWDDPVTDGIEEILGKENVILDGCRSHGLTDTFENGEAAAAIPTEYVCLFS